MKLPLPIIYGSKYTNVEITTPSGEVIADTAKIIKQGNIYAGIYNFVAGCITRISGEKEVDKPGEIKTIARHLKYKAAEWIYIQALLLIYDGVDYVEGVYSCPRCGEKVIAEETSINDTRDRISDLELNYLDGDDYYEWELSNNLEIKNKKTGEVLYDIKTIGLRHPTMEDYIQACAKYGDSDRVRLQYDVFAKCIESVNGQAIDNSFRNTWGGYIFEKHKNIRDLNKISQEYNKYGYQTKITKRCMSCGKEWQENLNTANFFVSALQSVEN
jgi:predicted RNA-binding Zn-ribbon protein involved in translation (DUF1610 family)